MLGDRPVRVGLQRNTPPFSFSAAGPFWPAGYSVDLARAVFARVLGPREWEAVEVTSTTREGLLAEHVIDIECGSTTITQARLQRHAFSRPIFRTAHRIAVKPGHDAASLGVVTGIQGSTSQAALEGHAGLSGYTFRGVPSIGAAWEAFTHDDGVGAIVADEVILTSLLTGPEGALLDLRLGDELYGFMLRHGDDEFIRAVDDALDAIFDSADYPALRDRWFPDSVPDDSFVLPRTIS